MIRKLLFFIFTVLAILSPDVLSGQEGKIRLIGIETGSDYQACQSTNYDFIRGTVDVSTFGINNDVNNLSLSFQKWYVGAKVEYRIYQNKIGIFSGIRFSQAKSSLSKSTTYSGTSNFFYLLNKQEGTTTEFLKITEINRTSNYLGIPAGIKYHLFSIFSMNVFVKAAGEINYYFNTTSDVKFYNNEMEPYKDEVLEKFKDPNKLLIMFYGAFGLRIGKTNKANISIESVAPSYIITKNPSGLVESQTGGGFQINIQIPF